MPAERTVGFPYSLVHPHSADDSQKQLVMSPVLLGVGRIYDKGQTCQMATYCIAIEFKKDHQKKSYEEKTNSSLVEHSAPSVDIRPMAAVQSELMPHCGAISIVLT